MASNPCSCTEAETESGPLRAALDVAILGAFSSQGFDTMPEFRRQWAALSSAGRVRSSAGFRGEFCTARHVAARLRGSDKQFAVVRGFPVEYTRALSGHVLLRWIGPQSFVAPLVRAGRRIPPPDPCPQPDLRWRGPRKHSVTVFFSPPGSSVVRDGERERLREWWSALPASLRARIEQGDTVVVLSGFASTTQPAAANKRLSQLRVVQVRSVLMPILGPRARYALYPFGETRARTRDEVEDPKERRVEVSVTVPGSLSNQWVLGL